MGKPSGAGLLDLRTGRKVTANAQETVALRGALVGIRGDVSALFTDGPTVKLSEDATAAGLAARGSRVYWHTGDVAHTAVLDLPEGDSARAPSAAAKLGRCTLPKGARLVRW